MVPKQELAIEVRDIDGVHIYHINVAEAQQRLSLVFED